MFSPHISIVSPFYKAKNIIPELVSQIERSVQEITENFEIILVGDDIMSSVEPDVKSFIDR